jgi:hypothetical protein
MKRQKMNRRHSERAFTHHARKVHRKNVMANPMRGGIRL